jgi:hypothetical protein
MSLVGFSEYIKLSVSKILDFLLPGKSKILFQNYPGYPGTRVVSLMVKTLPFINHWLKIWIQLAEMKNVYNPTKILLLNLD